VFAPGGKFLLSVSDDKSIRIWDLHNGRCYRKMMNAHNHFISSIDMKNKVVVTGSVDNTVKVWSCR
jgi:platelet-activating factor acetylhydrolase IB subunit alpha